MMSKQGEPHPSLMRRTCYRIFLGCKGGVKVIQNLLCLWKSSLSHTKTLGTAAQDCSYTRTPSLKGSFIFSSSVNTVHDIMTPNIWCFSTPSKSVYPKSIFKKCEWMIFRCQVSNWQWLLWHSWHRGSHWKLFSLSLHHIPCFFFFFSSMND